MRPQFKHAHTPRTCAALVPCSGPLCRPRLLLSWARLAVRCCWTGSDVRIYSRMEAQTPSLVACAHGNEMRLDLNSLSFSLLAHADLMKLIDTFEQAATRTAERPRTMDVQLAHMTNVVLLCGHHTHSRPNPFRPQHHHIIKKEFNQTPLKITKYKITGRLGPRRRRLRW